RDVLRAPPPGRGTLARPRRVAVECVDGLRAVTLEGRPRVPKARRREREMSRSKAPIRLLVVDDSAYNRRNIAEVFVNYPEVEVVGKAADGEEALRLATLLKP